MINETIAQHLLQIKAIKLNPTNPFTWSSGLKAPIYCDNRKSLSYPTTRNIVKKGFLQLIEAQYSDAGVIAAVATGAIAMGAVIADALNKPLVYIRPKAKSHGLQNRIEGEVREGQRVVVIEDLISTGNSSLAAVDVLREKNCKVLGMAAIFTYGLSVAAENFENKQCKLYTLCDYKTVIKLALQINYIDQIELNSLLKWHDNPQEWKP